MWLTDRAKSGATVSGPLPEFINKVLLAHSLLSGIICGCFYIVAELNNCNRDPHGPPSLNYLLHGPFWKSNDSQTWSAPPLNHQGPLLTIWILTPPLQIPEAETGVCISMSFSGHWEESRTHSGLSVISYEGHICQALRAVSQGHLTRVSPGKSVLRPSA